MNTISSQIDNRNFVSMPRREGVDAYHTSSPSNKGSEQNFITQREARHLADFVVALTQNMIYFIARKPKNQLQGRSLQFGRILYL